MAKILAVLDKSGVGAKQAVAKALNLLERTKLERIEVVSPQLPKTKGIEKTNIRAATSAAVGSVLSGDDLSITEFGHSVSVFQGRIYSPILGSSLAVNIAGETSTEHEKALEKTICCFEGDFASIIVESSRIVVVRDPVGVQPLYYGENATYAAVGSNRSVLWKIGIEEPRSFPPGNLGVITNQGFRFKPVKTLTFSEPKQMTMEEAADNIVRMLENAVQVRVHGEKEIAVAFSGGLDSSTVAFLARRSCEVRLVHVSLRGQPETEEAKRAADEMKLPLDVHLFGEEDVAAAIRKVVELIEKPDPLDTAIGIAFHWTAQKTAEAGFKVLLAGQGADELFAGYRRYANEYFLHGEEKARRTMFEDIIGIHESNIERDKKICNFHNIELRLPFASYEMAKFASSMPVALKLDCKLDSLRKLVLRRASEKMGLPLWIARKPKKALQYGTGISSALKRVARKRKATVNHLLEEIFTEKTTGPEF